jgi:ketopantoate reductase
MKILIVGAGGIGSYFGVKLLRAGAGYLLAERKVPSAHSDTRTDY